MKLPKTCKAGTYYLVGEYIGTAAYRTRSLKIATDLQRESPKNKIFLVSVVSPKSSIGHWVSEVARVEPKGKKS